LERYRIYEDEPTKKISSQSGEVKTINAKVEQLIAENERLIKRTEESHSEAVKNAVRYEEAEDQVLNRIRRYNC
jgi:outer membrane murein-binding lipoprotein Lpp